MIPGVARTCHLGSGNKISSFLHFLLPGNGGEEDGETKRTEDRAPLAVLFFLLLLSLLSSRASDGSQGRGSNFKWTQIFIIFSGLRGESSQRFKLGDCGKGEVRAEDREEREASTSSLERGV